MRTVDAIPQTFAINGIFRISRGSKTSAQVIAVSIAESGYIGRGECVPYARYGETIESVMDQIRSMTPAIEAGMDLSELQSAMAPGAARNAVDCALWDLRAQKTRQSLASVIELGHELQPVLTAFTISLDAPAAMGKAAAVHEHLPILKLKLGGDGDLERVRAVRAAAPHARLMVDANEAWSIDHLRAFAPEFAAMGVELIEQPLPADADDFLKSFNSPVPLAADESCRTLMSLSKIVGKYEIANIKLDKAGGLTEALSLQAAARASGLGTMVGCMVATSLSMAPGIILAQRADVVHLDGPLLLAEDRTPSLRYSGATLYPPEPEVWGG
ncbi:N-acetyl-D-Glu racemase DgcA [Rhodococcus opacus]|uniref:N-acetyl-D-Glu racemase DgcA n=1 Tax=Rhodococcus TaxID=1827 RepID=UPI00196A1728|nr:N-acetyl-D-Glu racemase DgcA [Rhodococcus opacus]MDJ0415375.1 dipeptide epimerase [Rhodococcus opacus]MDV7090490.1 N-acetyl-D-Glu racemase DgcA [Rhodococcus opacus]UNN04691.1 dipeptide epimerase [Rhodococcus opacus]